MKKGIHPENYRIVAFKDMSNDHIFLTKSTAVTKETIMTGEITLRGKVLPVGGIKEKILAAKRAGINEIILSAENRKNIEDIKNIYLQGVSFHYVQTISEVIGYALLEERIDNPQDIS